MSAAKVAAAKAEAAAARAVAMARTEPPQSMHTRRRPRGPGPNPRSRCCNCHHRSRSTPCPVFPRCCTSGCLKGTRLRSDCYCCTRHSRRCRRVRRPYRRVKGTHHHPDRCLHHSRRHPSRRRSGSCRRSSNLGCRRQVRGVGAATYCVQRGIGGRSSRGAPRHGKQNSATATATGRQVAVTPKLHETGVTTTLTRMMKRMRARLGSNTQARLPQLRT